MSKVPVVTRGGGAPLAGVVFTRTCGVSVTQLQVMYTWWISSWSGVKEFICVRVTYALK